MQSVLGSIDADSAAKVTDRHGRHHLDIGRIMYTPHAKRWGWLQFVSGNSESLLEKLPRQAVSNKFILKTVTKTLLSGGTVEKDRWCDFLVSGGLDDQKMSNWDWKLDERIDLPQDDDYLRRGCPFRILDSTSH